MPVLFILFKGYLCSFCRLGQELLIALILFLRERKCRFLCYTLESVPGYRILIKFYGLEYYLLKLLTVLKGTGTYGLDILADNCRSDLLITLESSGSYGRNFILLSADLYGRRNVQVSYQRIGRSEDDTVLYVRQIRITA